ncbi:DUF262 domain-containing protein [Tibeticola sp.]|uniref:GmrSD restriction endonuclease domain-containing protein n=1 Tax=Tibeticola sp. TaxID=2005368 RepID=UPI0025E19FAD|nr:DUF262 domain-containing protein [Tibeticola sp.]
MSAFDSTKRLLPEILGDIVKGKIQLPDFQRGWVWDDNHIRSLLVSVARSFPVGAVMLLQTGGNVRFQIRPVEGVSFPATSGEAELLILDGQQRLTTLTQVLKLSVPVATRNEKGKRIDRYYYWDISKALQGNAALEDALVALEPDRKLKTDFGRVVTLDLSAPEMEFEHMYFPCNQTLDWTAWLQGLNQHNPEKLAQFLQFQQEVLAKFSGYQLPIIQLDRATSKEAVCLVFEKVNTGGVPLNVFELVTATYAADGYNLRDDWYGSKSRGVESRKARLDKEPVLQQVEATDFLQAVTMLHTLELRRKDLAEGKKDKQVTPVSAKRATILELELGDYKKWGGAYSAGPVEQGFLLAAKFLRKEHIRDPRELPYRTQLAPLAAVLTVLQERWLEPRINEKLSRWYWCGVLGELYGGAVETRIANDVDELLRWVDEDDVVPRTVSEASFNPDRLDRLTSRLSAAYKGINMLILREGAADFFWKAKIQELDQEDIALDIHHIFPQAWCEKKGIKPSTYNAIINRTPISYKANRMIGGDAPSRYLRRLQEHKQVQIADAAMNDLLLSHRIDPEFLRADDFEGFYKARKTQLLRLIEQVMGKTVEETGDSTASDQPDFADEVLPPM